MFICTVWTYEETLAPHVLSLFCSPLSRVTENQPERGAAGVGPWGVGAQEGLHGVGGS